VAKKGQLSTFKQIYINQRGSRVKKKTDDFISYNGNVNSKASICRLSTVGEVDEKVTRRRAGKVSVHPKPIVEGWEGLGEDGQEPMLRRLTIPHPSPLSQK
jgi:hypothetical protein